MRLALLMSCGCIKLGGTTGKMLGWQVCEPVPSELPMQRKPSGQQVLVGKITMHMASMQGAASLPAYHQLKHSRQRSGIYEGLLGLQIKEARACTPCNCST